MNTRIELAPAGGKRWWSLLSSIGLVAIGSIIGLSSAVFVLPRLVPGAAKEAGREREALRAPRAGTSGNALALGQIERRLSSLEEAQVQALPAPGASEQAASEPAARTGPGVRERIGQELEIYGSEPTEPEWGPTATTRFSSDLSSLGQLAKFETVAVECRTTRCRADVAWASEAEAEQQWQSLLGHDYQVNCDRYVRVREQPDALGRFHADVVFDCEEQRSSEI